MGFVEGNEAFMNVAYENKDIIWGYKGKIFIFVLDFEVPKWVNCFTDLLDDHLMDTTEEVCNQ